MVFIDKVQDYGHRPATAATARWPSTGKNMWRPAARTAATAAQGGNIVLRVNDNLSTLHGLPLQAQIRCAHPAATGRAARCSGKRGEDLVIQVPRGTVVRDAATNADHRGYVRGRATFVLCKGGRGGWGNSHFATPTRQVPRFAKAGPARRGARRWCWS